MFILPLCLSFSNKQTGILWKPCQFLTKQWRPIRQVKDLNIKIKGELQYIRQKWREYQKQELVMRIDELRYRRTNPDWQ